MLIEQRLNRFLIGASVPPRFNLEKIAEERFELTCRQFAENPRQTVCEDAAWRGVVDASAAMGLVLKS
jgi:hypothetical protein